MSDPHTAPPIGAAPDDSRDSSSSDRQRPAQRRTAARAPTQVDYDNPHPLYCVWEITLKCDLGCKHCGSRAGKARPDELSTAECLDVVRQLDEIGIREVTLIGGEAYLRDDWHVIAREITDRGMLCGMTTGARNLTDARLQQAVDANLKIVSISIDGLEQTHDALRGAKGSWKSALGAAKRIASTPIRLATNTQINRLSMPEMPAMADLLAEIGSRAWQIQLTVAMGRGADRADLLLAPHDLLDLFPLLVWIKQTKLEPNGITLFPGNNIGYFGPYEYLLRYGGKQGAHWSGCSAGKWSIGLEANGAIKGCPSLQSNEYTGGNFRTHTLEDVVYNSHEVSHIKNRTRDGLWGFCKTCYYGDVCLGGCSWTSHSLLGKPGNNPYCIHRALDFESRGLRETVVKIEDAPGLPFDRGLYEIRVEPIPEPIQLNPVAKILGLNLDDVIKLSTASGSAWSESTRKERLQVTPAPK